MARLGIHLTGQFLVTLDGKKVEGFSTTKARALLAYLAVESDRVHYRRALAGLLWPESPERLALHSLRNALANLRQVLSDPEIAPPILLINRHTIQFNTQSDSRVDVNALGRLLEIKGFHDVPKEKLEEAVRLYKGEFLEGISLPDSIAFEEWALIKREQLKRQMMRGLNRLAGQAEAEGAYSEAIQFARQQVELDAWQERGQQQLMRLLMIRGRRSEALAQYESFRSILEKELGVEPARETKQLYESIRDETLEVPKPSTASVQVDLPIPAFLDVGAPSGIQKQVFVGREGEIAELHGHLNDAVAGKFQVVFVTGGPGRGKTALMTEFAQRAMAKHPDLLVAQGNCNAISGLGDPYLPFREIMGMLTGDVEALWSSGGISQGHAQRLWAGMLPAMETLVERGPFLINSLVSGASLVARASREISEAPKWFQELSGLSERRKFVAPDMPQSAFFEQVTSVVRSLAAQHPLLLLIDDLQWADSGSASMLFHLGRRLGGCQAMIICAYRPEEVALTQDGERHPLEKVLNEFKRHFGDVWLDLTRLDDLTGRKFVDELLDREPNRLGEDFRATFFERTAGHPLFTIELLRAMQDRGDLVQDEQGQWAEGGTLAWEGLPAKVVAVIQERVDQLDEKLRDLLTVASVEGERFTAQVVARVIDTSERKLFRYLSQDLGVNHRIVRERGEVQIGSRLLTHYQFAHALFQEHLYNRLSSAERRSLHGEIAVALEELYEGQIQAVVVELAHHYTAAGWAEKATEHLLRAGKQARWTYANEEAVSYFQRALAMLEGARFGESRKDWQLEALKGLGLVYFGMGKVKDAEGPLRSSIALGKVLRLGPRELVRLYYSLSEVLFWQGKYDAFLHTGEEGLALLGDDLESVEAALMNHVVATGHLWGLDDLDNFRLYIKRNEEFVQGVSYTEELAPVFVMINVSYMKERNVTEATKWLKILEEKATEHHDLRALGDVQFYLGRISRANGDLSGAISKLQQSLNIYEGIGDLKHAGWSRDNMVSNYLQMGDVKSAAAHIEKALEAAKNAEHRSSIVDCLLLMGCIALCQGDQKQALTTIQQGYKISRENGNHYQESWAAYHLGQTYISLQKFELAAKQFQKSITLWGVKGQMQFPYGFFLRLSGLEAAYDDHADFRAFCRIFQEEYPEVEKLAFVRWYLEPADLGNLDLETLYHDGFIDPLSPSWTREDSFEDCHFTVEKGLEIHAANGRSLWHNNLSAPRVLRPATGELVIQTVCTPVSKNKPAIGGLLFWVDKDNFLRLDRGITGEGDIFFGGCLRSQDTVIGRGRMSLEGSGRVFLRLGRSENEVRAYCSANGKAWSSVGKAKIHVEDPIQVGVHAIGDNHREIYHGAYPNGTAIRFEEFQMWALDRIPGGDWVGG